MRTGPYIIILGAIIQIGALAANFAGEDGWQYWHAIGWAAFLTGVIVDAIED